MILGPLRAPLSVLEMENCETVGSHRIAGRGRLACEGRKRHWLGHELPITSGEHQQAQLLGALPCTLHFCYPGPSVPTMPLPPVFNLSPGEGFLISALPHQFCCSLSPCSV